MKSSIQIDVRGLGKMPCLILFATLLLNSVPVATLAQSAPAQTTSRKVKVSVAPTYPELARKMSIEGLARVLATVNADGTVAGVKELGGNPILLDALIQAVRKWKYESADHESQIEVKYQFVLSH